MKDKRYRPLVDKLFYLLAVPTFIIVALPTVICGILAPNTLYIMLPIFVFTAYFFVSPLFGYVELRDYELYIKYGFMMSRTIPYNKIRKIEKERKAISTSFLSIKNALDHVNIRYNTFDTTTVSLKDEEDFLSELNAKCNGRLL